MRQVSRRGGFSDRNGIKKESTQIQLKEFDSRTRIKIMNCINEWYAYVYKRYSYWENEVQSFFRFIMGDVFSEAVDPRKQINDDEFFACIQNVIYKNEYDDVLTILEAIVQYWDEVLQQRDSYSYGVFGGTPTIFSCFNDFLKQEYIGYRFVDGIIVPISDDNEVKEIEEALNNPYEVVKEHLSKSNLFLADRERPDYENSIKESISAVEAICEILTGLKGKEATLGNMLKKLEERGVVIHGGLKSAFNILYGYTSDANGIRHAGDIGGPASTFEEAKFMLVSCSAFINYLMGVWSACK